MNALITIGPALPGVLTTAEIDATMAYAVHSCYVSRAGLRGRR